MHEPNVDRMLADMTSEQFTEWQGYYAHHHMIESPFERFEVALAIAAAAICNRLGTKAVKPTDLMPQWDEPDKQPQSPDQLYATMTALARKSKEREERRQAAKEQARNGSWRSR